MSHSVAIIGGGFVGQAVAEELNNQKYQVKASFRSSKPEVEVSGVEYLFCDVTENSIECDDALFMVDSMLVCIPPGFRHDAGTSYTGKIKTIVEKAEKAGVKQLIFTSSTGIYSKGGINDENTVIDLSPNKCKVLHSAEQALLNSCLQYKQVLRLSGLIGGRRHPGKFKVAITSDNANVKVNMVMLEDVVGAIVAVIEDLTVSQRAKSPVYNVVSPHHPNRQSFYRFARQQLGKLEEPAVVTRFEDASDQKLVVGDLITENLNFSYQHDDLFRAFAHKF